MLIPRRSILACLTAWPGLSAFAAVAGWQAQALEQELGCPVITPERGAKYRIAVDLWNGRWNRRPLFIVKCRNAEDVSRCIRFANRRRVPLSVKAGGHHPAGWALRDGGMTLDVSDMVDIHVDAAGRRATVGPGVRIGHLQAMLEPHNLFAVGAMTSTVGMAGMAMGGGYGWFSGEAGFAVDNLLAATIVTADGTIRKIDEQHEPDLFWAIRGGGGNFGVVTSLTFRVHDLKPLTGGLLVYAGPQARTAATGWAQYSAVSLPREILPALILTPAAQDPSVPTAVVMIKSALQGQANDEAMTQLRSFGQPVLDTVRPVSLTEVQTFADLDGEPGYRYAVNSHFLRRLPDEAIDIMLAAIANAPSPQAMMLWGPQHGAMRDRGPKDTAFFHREALYNGFILSRWSDPADDEKNVRWVRRLWEDLRPYATGQVFPSFISEIDPQWARIGYGGNEERLSRIKRRYDPSNLFSSTVNIRPHA